MSQIRLFAKTLFLVALFCFMASFGLFRYAQISDLVAGLLIVSYLFLVPVLAGFLYGSLWIGSSLIATALVSKTIADIGVTDWDFRHPPLLPLLLYVVFQIAIPFVLAIGVYLLAGSVQDTHFPRRKPGD